MQIVGASCGLHQSNDGTRRARVSISVSQQSSVARDKGFIWVIESSPTLTDRGHHNSLVNQRGPVAQLRRVVETLVARCVPRS